MERLRGCVLSIGNVSSRNRGFCYRQVVLSVAGGSRCTFLCVYVFANRFSDFRLISNMKIGGWIEFSVVVESLEIRGRWLTFVRACNVIVL